MVDITALDTQIFLFIQQFTGNRIVDLFFLVAAETLVLLVPAVLIYLWFESPESRRDSLFTFTATISGITATYLLGVFYFHHQPFYLYETIVPGGELNNAFPSQHTATMFSVFWSFVYLKRKKLAWLFGITGAITGFSRVFVGLHYPLDILGGIFSGLIGLMISYLVFRLLDSQISELIRFSYNFERAVYSILNSFTDTWFNKNDI